ncbi:MAG: hypothetical protein ACK40O_09445 [Allosphingosinicella sp.]
MANRVGKVARRYETLKPARFTITMADGQEEIRIGARRNWLIIPFLLLWLLAWSGGGVAAIVALSRTGDPFLIGWLAFWFVAWLFAAITLAWQVAGAEIIRVEGSDLAIGWSLPGLRRTHWYRGADIRNLAAVSAADPFGWIYSAYPPFLTWRKMGSIKFNYGARTVRAAAALDEAEGRMVVDHLRKRLPARAFET